MKKPNPHGFCLQNDFPGTSVKLGKGLFPAYGFCFRSPLVPTAYLITHMQCKEEHKHPCGRVAAVVLGPPVMDVLEEGWVVNLDLQEEEEACEGFGPGSEQLLAVPWECCTPVFLGSCGQYRGQAYQ